MALKDASDLVKMYAMVNVNQYQIVATGATVADCEGNYRRMLRQSNLISDEQASLDAVQESDLQQMEGTIEEIRSAVIEGTSVYYLRFAGEDAFSVYVSAAAVPSAPLLNVGDRVTVFWSSQDSWIIAQKITVDNRTVSAPPETETGESAAEEPEVSGDSVGEAGEPADETAMSAQENGRI